MFYICVSDDLEMAITPMRTCSLLHLTTVNKRVGPTRLLTSLKLEVSPPPSQPLPPPSSSWPEWPARPGEVGVLEQQQRRGGLMLLHGERTERSMG